MIKEIFDNIEKTYKDKTKIIRRIKAEYKTWIKAWKDNYAQLVVGLAVLTDKTIDWSTKDEEISSTYKDLIKKLRKHMKKLETTI